MNHALSPIEYHIIQLKSITELLDSILNHVVLNVRGEHPNNEIYFKNETNQKFFNIVLVDLLSKFTKCEDLLGIKGLTGIEIIRKIAEERLLNYASADRLLSSADTLQKWLSTTITVEKLWFPSIDLETSLSLTREDFIYICGNISKHCFPKLTTVTKRIIKIFDANATKLSEADALTIIPEFYEWFHANIFTYLGTSITEMLNNVRWGIQEYLTPVYNSSIRYIDKDGGYEFLFPPEVNAKFAKNCFWDLMNEVRRKPHIQIFKCPRHFKVRY